MVIWLGDGKHGIVLPTLLNLAEHNLSTAQPARPVGLPQEIDAFSTGEIHESVAFWRVNLPITGVN